jgi:hypothetical protein
LLSALTFGIDGDQVACGDSHSLLLTLSGAVLASGSNFFGQLGDGTSADHAGVKPVKATWTTCPRGAIAVAAGYASSAVVSVTAAGATELYTWGCNDFGVLGQGSVGGPDVLVPSKVIGVRIDVLGVRRKFTRFVVALSDALPLPNLLGVRGGGRMMSSTPPQPQPSLLLSPPGVVRCNSCSAFVQDRPARVWRMAHGVSRRAQRHCLRHERRQHRAQGRDYGHQGSSFAAARGAGGSETISCPHASPSL